MKKYMKQFSFNLLFCLIFIMGFSFFNINVYADPTGITRSYTSGMEVVTGLSTFSGETIESASSIHYGTGNLTSEGFILNTEKDGSALFKTIRQAYCKEFQKCSENKYEDTAFVDSVTIKIGSQSEQYIPITTIDYSEYFCNNEDIDERIKITFKIDGVSRTFYTYTSNCVIGQEKVVRDGKEYIEDVWGDRTSFDSDEFINETVTIMDEKIEISAGYISKNCQLFMEELGKAARLGIIAGSIGSGYNVGTVYSDKQISLYDAMTKNSDNKGFYDFKNLSAMKSTFDFYMNPLLGRVEFVNSGETIPSTLDDWTNFVTNQANSNVSDFIDSTIVDETKKYSIILDPVFSAFETGLSTTQINDQGYKIDSTFKIKNGIRKVSDVALSEDPKTVLSYNMKIALPYIFYKSNNDKYKLDTNQLRVLDNYTYCVANDRMYKNDGNTESLMNSIADINSLELNRKEMFFYKYQYGNQVYGVVLIGRFHEGVIDPKTGETFATGRNIAFNNGYSDLLTLNEKNANLMYGIGALSNSGKIGMLPLNFAFLINDSEEAGIKEFRDSIGANTLENEDNSKFIPLTLDNDTLYSQVKDGSLHTSIKSPQYFKILIGFLEPLQEQESEQGDKETQVSGFVLYRNNYYINDSELLSWLASSEAHGISYVKADELIAKITGDFTKNMEKLTYEDWMRMQKIKSELEHEKDNWLVRFLNVMCMVLGVFLIIFAILLCLFFWVDIFNTFSDFSFLYFISFGNLYPIEDKDNMPYIADTKGVTKFVTFPQLLVIAIIMCAFGILFLNVNTLIYFIIGLYQYIMYLFTFL